MHNAAGCLFAEAFSGIPPVKRLLQEDEYTKDDATHAAAVNMSIKMCGKENITNHL